MKDHEAIFYTNPKDGCEMVRVPGGWFWMGSEYGDGEAFDREKPRHRHHVAPYWIGLECVTVEQFGRFVQETGYDAGSNWKNDPPEYPVRYVNWFDAEVYAEWSGLWLPTEAEWELAARGNEGRKYPWGENWEDGKRVCWSNQKGPKGATVPVYSHPEGVGPFGTFQQAGNLLQWCADWYDGSAYKRYATGDYSLPKSNSGRVLRGGSWINNDPRSFRGALRGDGGPRNRLDDRGIRMARTVTL